VEPFSVRIAVRGYELDPRGHVNHAVYLQYAEHARWECLKAAGITHEVLDEAGIGPAALENTIRYRAELRADDEVDVSVEFTFGERKVFTIEQRFVRLDGTVVATLSGIVGMLDLAERRLVPEPAARLRALATAPALLGL
jgi:acyl-CoA thioester hydrolase